MRKPLIALLAILAVTATALVTATAAYAAAKPVVTGISLRIAPANSATKITITGRHFKKGAVVRFGGVKGTSVKVINSRKITVVTPRQFGTSVPVRVTTKAGKSAKSGQATLTYLMIPAVSGLSEQFGTTTGGETLTVSGSDFTQVSKVLFGSTPGTNLNVTSTRSLTVVAPAGAAGITSVRVVTPGGTSPVTLGSVYVRSAPPPDPDPEPSPQTWVRVAASSAVALNSPNCGATQTTYPCLTINYAINRALSLGRTEVRVGLGFYDAETVSLASGVAITGGYDIEAVEQIGVPPVIRGTLSGSGSWVTVNANSISAPTTLSTLHLLGAGPTVGNPSYVISGGEDHLTLSNVVVSAAPGGFENDYP